MTTATTSPPSTTPSLPSQPQNDPSTQPSPESYNTQIDLLLTRYLSLLDEYTTLHSSLSSLQAGMYQNLARANFAAERGVRYGKDYFDERMVASRRLRLGMRTGDEGEDGTEGEDKVEEKGEQKVEFRVVKVDEEDNEMVKEKKEESGSKEAGKDGTEQAGTESKDQDQDQDTTNPADGQKEDTNPEKDDGNDTPEETAEEKKAKLRKIRNDPLRWFGLLTPLPLRLAQTQAIQAVEEIIPRLVTVNAEMAQVEIEVRRARKRREKAEKVKGLNGAKVAV